MPVLTGGNVIGGAPDDDLISAGAPSAGTAAVQTITFGGTISGGKFQLKCGPFVTADIDWSATDATLVANIDAALEALPNIGSGAIVTADSTLTSGIGDATVTWAAKVPVDEIAVAKNALTGTGPTIACANTTPGVAPTGVGAAKGALLTDVTNGVLYINTGTAAAPTWTKVGTQT